MSSASLILGGLPGPRLSGRKSSTNTAELVARADAQFGEHLVQVVLNRPGADEELGADVGVGEPVAGESGDLSLLRCEVVPRFHAALPRGLTGGLELATSALGEGLHAHLGQHLVGDPQLLARVTAPALATKPFAVDEVGAREKRPDPAAPEPLDRPAVELVGALVLGEHCPRAGLDPQRPVGAARLRGLGEPLEGGDGEVGPRAAGGRLDHLGQSPERNAKLLGSLGRPTCSGQRPLVTAVTVVEPRVRQLGDGQPDTLAPLRVSRIPVASVTVATSSISDPAADSSPAKVWTTLRMLRARGSSESAPTSRASCTWRAESQSQAS